MTFTASLIFTPLPQVIRGTITFKVPAPFFIGYHLTSIPQGYLVMDRTFLCDIRRLFVFVVCRSRGNSHY